MDYAYNATHNAKQSMDYAYYLQIIPVIHGLYESNHNLHEHELLALHQVRSFKRKTKYH